MTAPNAFVKTVDPKSRLALRKAPAYVRVSKNSWEDTDKKGKLVIMMDNDTLLRVITPGVGYKCRWHHVEVVDDAAKYDEAKKIQTTEALYCYAEFVQPQDGVPEFLPTECIECPDFVSESSRSTPFPEWAKMDECSPFFDEFTCSYYITVLTQYTSTDTDRLKIQKKEALQQGVDALLRFYDKQRDADYVNRLMSAFEFASVPNDGWHLDERPGSHLRILVKVPAKYFDAIPMRIIAPPSGSFRSTRFRSDELRNDIETVASRLNSYAEDVAAWYKPTPDLNLRNEAQQLRAFTTRFIQFVKLNGREFREDAQDTFELGFEGPCFKLDYVLADQSGSASPLQIGFDCFRESEPIVYERVMGYVFYLKEMVREIKRTRRPWIDFIQDYACPLPSISPSKGGDTTDGSLLREIEDKPVKTHREKEAEDLRIYDPQLKERLARLREDVYDFIGDSLFDCDNIQTTLARLETIEDIYDEILNKADLKDVAGFAASCVTSRLPLVDLEELACSLALKKMPLDQLQTIIADVSTEATNAINDGLEAFGQQPVGAPIGTKQEQIVSLISNNVPCVELRPLIDRVDPFAIGEIIRQISPAQTAEDIKDAVLALPKIPTIFIPDDFPTEDIMAAIGIAIVDGIRSTLSRVLISLIREAFTKLCEVCLDTPNVRETYGDESLNDVLERSGKSPSNAGRRIMEDVGLSDEDFDNGGSSASIKDFFEDLSALLTPRELCALLEGTAAVEVIRAIEQLLKTSYPSAHTKLSTPNIIVDVFVELGKLVDPDACRTVSERVVDAQPCVQEPLRRDLLEGRLDADQLAQQLERIKERDRAVISSLFGLIDGEQDVLGDAVSAVMPNPCSTSSRPNTALVPSNPPSVDFLNERVVSTMFGGVEMAFDNDLRGFLDSLMFFDRARQLTDQADRQTIAATRASYGKSLDDLEGMSQDDTRRLMSDPTLSGVPTSLRNEVAPTLKKVLADAANFQHAEHVEQKSAVYNLRAALPDVQRRIDQIRDQAFQGRPDKRKQLEALITSLNQPDAPTPKTVVITAIGLIETDLNVCKDESVQKDNALMLQMIQAVIINFMSKDTIVQYALPPLSASQDPKNDYSVYVNDPRLDEPIKIKQNTPLKPDVKNAVSSFRFDAGVSSQQQVFAHVVARAWQRVANPKGLPSITDPEGVFQKYHQGLAYHQTTSMILNNIASQVASSKLFNRVELQRTSFIPEDASDESLCPPLPTNESSLLDFNEIHERARLDLEREQTTCDDERNAIESAGTNGVVETMIKLFVVDYMLRGLFIFSEFRIQDLFGDGSIVEYFVQRIVASFQAQGADLYRNISNHALRLIHRRGHRTIDPFETDPNDPNVKPLEIKTPNDALRFLIRESIKSTSVAVEQILGSNIQNPTQRLIDKWIENTELTTNRDENQAARFYDEFFKRNPNGGFILEKYARLCGGTNDGEVVQTVVAPDTLKATRASQGYGKELQPPIVVPQQAQAISYGIRLAYVPNPKQVPSFGFGLNDPRVARREKTYELHRTMDNGKPGQTYNPVPLIIIEEDEGRERALFGSALDAKFAELKIRMVESVEFRTLFEYAFSLSRLLSLITIYSIEALSISIDGIDDTYESTRHQLRTLMRSLKPDQKGLWWNKPDPDIEGAGGNQGIRQTRMNNMTTSGPTPSLARMAAMTVPLLIKGMADKVDPSYALIKGLHSVGEANLDWGDVPKVAPINIFGPFGFGPVLTSWGATALSIGPLAGERRAQKRNENARKIDKNEECEDE